VLGGRRDDGDQSQLKGDKAQVLRNQWDSGMDYNPAHLDNDHLSGWLRALWSGDYEVVMGFINKVEKKEVNQLLEIRESLLNVSAVFHVIIGARTLCGQNPLFRDIQMAANRMMEVKNKHQDILAKLLELGANIHAKDIAGYTPLHHCLTSYSNSTTMFMARQLLKAGANPNLQNRFGCTPLFEPVMAANLDAVKLLLEFGGDPDIKENDAGISCRYTATFLPKVKYEVIMDLSLLSLF
jgi:ankyrin repeat protein